MRHFLIGAGFFAVLCAVVLRVPAAEPEWAGRMNRAENWTKNASGELNIVQENGAVRFEAFFAEAGDLWFYPVFALRQFDSAAGCTELSFEVKADCPGGIRHAFVIAGGRYLAYPVPGPEWRRVSVKLDPADAATLRTFSVGLNPENPGKTTLRVRGFRLVADGGPVDPSLLPPLPVVMAVKSKPVSGVFYDTEPVRFEFGGSIAGNLRYRVADWTGETVSAGAWPENGGRLLTLPELPRGYYTLALESDSRKFGEPMSFAVVADASTRKPNPESFFAVDTAQSWLSGAKKWNERFPGEQYEAVSELCRRAGFFLDCTKKHPRRSGGAFFNLSTGCCGCARSTRGNTRGDRPWAGKALGWCSRSRRRSRHTSDARRGAERCRRQRGGQRGTPGSGWAGSGSPCWHRIPVRKR